MGRTKLKVSAYTNMNVLNEFEIERISDDRNRFKIHRRRKYEPPRPLRNGWVGSGSERTQPAAGCG